MIARINFPRPTFGNLISHQDYFERNINNHIRHIKNALSAKQDLSATPCASSIRNYLIESQDKELLKEWSTEEPFCCATNPELLNLIYNHVRPLEQLLQALSSQITQAQQGRLWLSETLDDLHHQTQHCQRDFDNFRTKLNQALFQRCELAKKQGKARHLCQPMDYFAQRCDKSFKDLGRDKDLSDDVRIQIYDYLRQEAYLEKDLTFIYEPIAPRPLSFLNEKQRQANSTFRDSLSSVKKPIKRLLDIPKEPTPSVRFLTSLNKKLHDFTVWNFLNNQISQLHAWRYLVYFALSLTAAFALSTAFSPALTLILGAKAGELISSLLFSTIALAPGLSFIWQKSSTMLHWFRQKMQAKHNTELLEALENLRLNQQCLEGELARPILDTAYVNLNQLFDLLDDCKTRTSMTLSSPPFWMKLLTPSLEGLLETTQSLLRQQATLINERKLAYCDHLLDRLECDISTLKEDNEAGLIPAISLQQLRHSQHFIGKYGCEKRMKAFKKFLSLSPALTTAMERQLFLADNPYKQKDYLWGQCKPNEAALTGWETLAQKFPHCKIDPILLVLQGAWDGSIIDLKKITLSPELLAHVQDYIFACIHHLPSDYVHLLNPTQQQHILDWYDKHKSDIQNIRNFLNQLLTRDNLNLDSPHSIEDASKIVTLMDQAILAKALLRDSDFKHDIRDYLWRYDGEHPYGFCLVRYFSQAERLDVLQSIATKRLHWMLKHPERAHITVQDQELFNCPELHHEHVDFNFENTISDYLLSNPKTNALKPLLKLFKEHGFHTEPPPSNQVEDLNVIENMTNTRKVTCIS